MRGPLPSYRPEFPPTFLEQAAKIAWQRTVPYQLRQRAALVLLLAQHPLVSNSEVAQRVQLHPRSVRRWRHRWATGDFALDDQPGRGRKTAFPPLDHALVKAVACALVAETKQPLSRQSLADVTARVRTVLGTRISRSPVCHLRCLGRILHAGPRWPEASACASVSPLHLLPQHCSASACARAWQPSQPCAAPVQQACACGPARGAGGARPGGDTGAKR
jgi:Homeodomain-like domain